MSYLKDSVINDTISMVNDKYAIDLASKYGLNIVTVSYEDNARTKNSVWGPCISDMTLKVSSRNLPVIRSPNFTDLTWDVPIEKIPLIVGNEKGSDLKTISLKEYLQNFDQYTHEKSADKINLLRSDKKDSHVIMSSQSCFLPMEKGKETSFNVSIYNYQSYKGNPAVLTIVANASGTSAAVLDDSNQTLYFNKNGEKCSFVGQRLSENRKQKGETDLEKPMTSEEKQQNVLLVIQVPLKQKARIINPIQPLQQQSFWCKPIMNESCKRKSSVKSDVENVIIKVGKSEGKYKELDGLSIERDDRFPVRVTLQYYKATSNGVINEDNIKEISKQIQESRKYAEGIGSLVVSNSNRPTEHYVKHEAPMWWNEFWLIYKNNFPRFTKETAEEFIFKGGRFTDKGMTECEGDILGLMATNSENNLPSWEIF